MRLVTKETSAVVGVPFRLVPPVGFSNRFICTGISSDGAHDDETILVYDLFHHLNSFQVPEHITSKSLRYETWEEKQDSLTQQSI